MTNAASGPIVLVGAGNMGGAMLSGWLKSGVKGTDVLVVDPGPPPAMVSRRRFRSRRVSLAAPCAGNGGFEP